MKILWLWFTRLLSGKPHFFIGNADNPYLLRWYIIPPNPLLNIYLHKFLRDDEDRALHDHPWWFISVMLRGSYNEVVKLTDSCNLVVDRSAPSLAFRPATHTHRVVLERDNNGVLLPCWTLVITGRKSRVWGFHCPKGFVPWFDFVALNNRGEVGAGCGEKE